jgi:hypothetical protein
VATLISSTTTSTSTTASLTVAGSKLESESSCARKLQGFWTTCAVSLAILISSSAQ